MSVSLKCDNCGKATDDFSLPMRFSNGKTIIEIGILKGAQSLDFCRFCFTNLLVTLAIVVKPSEVDIGWEDKRWQSAPNKAEISK